MVINITQRMISDGKKEVEELLLIEAKGRDYNQWLYEQQEKFKSESQSLLTGKINKQEEVISTLDEEIANKDKEISEKDNKIDELAKQLQELQSLLSKNENKSSVEVKETNNLEDIKPKVELKHNINNEVEKDGFQAFAKKSDEVDATIQRKDELVKGKFAKENK